MKEFLIAGEGHESESRTRSLLSLVALTEILENWSKIILDKGPRRETITPVSRLEISSPWKALDMISTKSKSADAYFRPALDALSVSQRTLSSLSERSFL